MASPPSSPANMGSPSRFELTPKSKVRALMEALDGESSDADSDEEIGSGSARRARLVSAIAKTKEAKADATRGSMRELPRNTAKTEAENESEDESEDEIVRPIGRLAARMLEAQDQNNDKDQAQQRAKPTPRRKSPQTRPSSSESKEHDAAVVSRKRKVRVPRQSTPSSSPKERTVSPGLFVSPSAHRAPTPLGNASDSDELPTNPAADDRFKALVEKKRQERLAKEKELAAERARIFEERREQYRMLDDDEEVNDDTVERRLTQQNKPTRKASKRAIEEMHRETQRLSRNMQLAHNAITKNKITKASLFAKFNYKPTGFAEEDADQSARPTSSSSAAPPSDIDMHDTPPTSPASVIPEASHAAEKSTIVESESMALATEADADDEEKLLDFQDALLRIASSPPIKLDKGKAKVIVVDESIPDRPKLKFKQRTIRVRPPRLADRVTTHLDDSDSDLEIMNAKTPTARSKRLDSIFDRVPAKQAKKSHSLHTLRMLAHLTSPGKQNFQRNKKPSMTTSEMQLSLQQRARQQATREREERLQALRDKGVIFQTSEEREKEMAEVEDLLSKARRENEELQKREKAAAKKERKANGETDPLADNSSDDDWEEEEQLKPEELSGSELDEEEASGNGDLEASDEDDENELEIEQSEPTEATSNPMFDDEAGETDDDEAEGEIQAHVNMSMGVLEAAGAIDEELEEDAEELLPSHKQRRNRKTNVISDDEDEDEEAPVQETPVAPRTKAFDSLPTDSPVAPNSVLRSATKTFIPGLTVAGPAGLGLTQIFAGTMDESQIDISPGSPETDSQNHDPLAFLRQRSVPELPDFVPTMEDTQDFVMDSQSGLKDGTETQTEDCQTQMQLHFSQSQVHGFDSFVEDGPATQFSEMPDATQDAGFKHMTPIRGRFAEVPPSTVETVVLEPIQEPESVEETPEVKKKGKLRRRAPQISAFSDDEDEAEENHVQAEAEDLDITANVFDVMRKASKKKKKIVVDEFNKKKSKAKEMVHEQADESEDEYAGLGGASDDESGGEEDEYVKAIIDDEGGKDVDESKLAAFFADRERITDAKQVEKLYNDVTKGMLRRKRGADYDLSDSDDDGEARRRMKRKEFNKMRKALLSDERLGKIAENPKQQAFLRAIEDRGSDEEIGFLDDFPESEATTDSQSQSQSQSEAQRVPDSQPEIMGPSKRKHSDYAAEAENRLPPHLRRTKANQKPSNISEIRESLSSLIEEPNALLAAADSGSESEDELEIEGEPSQSQSQKENRNPFARKTNVETIDRIALKRASSSTSSSTRLAFTTSSSAPGFKVPALLRRAMTNSSLVSHASTGNSSVSGVSGMERMAGGSGEGVKRGGGKNSGVHHFANRETERKAAVVKTEMRRERKMVKGAEGRRKAVGGLFGGGKFE